MIWVAMKLLIELWNSQENNSETVTNENDKEISEERYIYIYIYIYIYTEERQKIIDDLRVI